VGIGIQMRQGIPLTTKIEVGKLKDYTVDEPTDDGLVRFTKPDGNTGYVVVFDPGTKTPISCNCTGFKYYNKCKHFDHVKGMLGD